MTSVPEAPTASAPTTASAGVAVVAIVGACIAVSTQPIQSVPLGLATAGLTMYALGILSRRRSHRLTGRLLTVVGVVLATTALVGVVALAPPLPTLLPILACGVGATAVTLGLFPVYPRVTRPLTSVGTALVFVGVIATVVVGTPPFWRAAVAVTLVFLSWDAANRAITIGNRVGRSATTSSAELTATAASSVVAVIAIVLTIVAARLSIDVSTIGGLALLLLATVLFVLALSHIPQQSDM